MRNPLADCKDCARRREAMVAAAKRMAEWIKHPFGPPPLDIGSNSPTLPPVDRPALKRKTESSR